MSRPLITGAGRPGCDDSYHLYEPTLFAAPRIGFFKSNRSQLSKLSPLLVARWTELDRLVMTSHLAVVDALRLPGIRNH